MPLSTGTKNVSTCFNFSQTQIVQTQLTNKKSQTTTHQLQLATLKRKQQSSSRTATFPPVMAYRLWVGGFSSWRTADEVGLWCLQKSGIWPEAVDIKWRGWDATKACAFISFTTEEQARRCLMEIHRNPEMWGERVTPKWSQDSQGATATTSKAAPPARPPQWPPGLPVPPKAPAASSATAGVATGKTTGPAVLAGVDGAVVAGLAAGPAVVAGVDGASSGPAVAAGLAVGAGTGPAADGMGTGSEMMVDAEAADGSATEAPSPEPPATERTVTLSDETLDLDSRSSHPTEVPEEG